MPNHIADIRDGYKIMYIDFNIFCNEILLRMDFYLQWRWVGYFFVEIKN